YFRKLMFENILAEEHRIFDGPEYELQRLININPEAAERAFAPRPAQFPPDAVAVADPVDQRRRRGWSLREPTSDGAFFRWSNAERTPVEFSSKVPAGDYVLRFRGARPNVVQATGPMRVEFGEQHFEVNPPPGEFELELTVRLTKPQRPVVWVEHPVWTQDEVGTRPGDRRP